MNQYLKVIIAVLALGLLAACAAPITQIPGGSDGQTLNADDPQVTNSYADIPIPLDDVLVVNESLLLNTGEQWTGRAVFRSKLSTSDVFTYFHQNMSTYGWISITSVQSEVSILTFEKANRVATVQINKRRVSGTEIKVTVTQREAVTN
ncbi:MAG: hypothetical protein GY881_11340 [Gammaproteobacteria bacterium]|nr:hypothetical protein [Gammaproteobacteria bacterium]MCP4879466.1 hypothetical protein [Gammaproteobacteria bacterium]MDP6164630.1 hypothetical protein [Gammaproteobacteria bacterium]